ncbi:MAG: LicD family protein, partial [Lachnospiraceae bacterium]|nr:LicD family protein [Lachnospiraceae bacterium]
MKDGFKERKEGFMKSGLVRPLTEEELSKLKSIVFEAFEDFDRTARKYGIFYTLSGGSVLGSIRHRGFIPWDDDMDLMMPRRDFNRFKEVFDRELGEKYTLCAPELGRGHGMAVCQMKRRGTVCRSYNELSKEDAGIALDIFILENTFNDPVRRVLHGALCMAAGLMISSRKTYEDLPHMERYFGENENLRQSFAKKAEIGRFFSFMSLDRVSRIVWKIYSLCGDDSSYYVAIPSGRKHYFGEMYRRKDMCRAAKGEFCGRAAPLPVGFRAYLKVMYGDNYMQLPPEGDREQHPV